jgi:hypothetical protein
MKGVERSLTNEKKSKSTTQAQAKQELQAQKNVNGEAVQAEAETILQKIVTETNGDLSVLAPQERFIYYKSVCESIGLNPLTMPLEFVALKGKLKLYAKKDATDQLRKIHGISITIKSRDIVNGAFCVVASATDKTGRTDEAIGVVYIENLKGEELANAMMKAETKAKRRVTLSIAGLGWLDETEVDDISDAQKISIQPPSGNGDTGKTGNGESKPAKTEKPAPAIREKKTFNLDEFIEQVSNGKTYLKMRAINPTNQKPFIAYVIDPEDIKVIKDSKANGVEEFTGNAETVQGKICLSSITTKTDANKKAKAS